MSILLKSILVIISIFLVSCSNNESLFSTPIESDEGNICFENTSGFLGSTVAGTSFDYILLVRSCGGLNLSNISFSLSGDSEIKYKGGNYPGEGGTCRETLKTGESCTIALSFEPLDTRSYLSTITAFYDDSVTRNSKTKTLSADSKPILKFEYGTEYDFGNKFIGSITNLRVRIENIGRVDAKSLSVGNLTAPYSFLGGQYPGTDGTCGSSLSIGQSCDLFISYNPTTNEQHHQTITLNYKNNGRDEISELNLKAYGFRKASLSVIDLDGYDFGRVSTEFTHQKVYRIDYLSGDIPASGLMVSGLINPFSQLGGTCTSSLNSAQGSCTIIIGFNSSTTGSFSNDISFKWNNGLELVTLEKKLLAQAQPRPVLSISQSSLNYGVINLHDSSDLTLTLSYDSGGIEAANINTSFLYGRFSRVGGTCGATLTSGSCTLVIRFNPSNYGTFSDTLTISYNDTQATRTLPVSLYGKTASVISFISDGIFPDSVTNQSSEKTLFLQAFPGHTATYNNVSLSGDFGFKGGSYPGVGGTCNSSITHNCRLILEFTPTVDGPRSGNLSLSYNDGIQDKTITLALSGNGTDPAILSVDNVSFPSTPLFSSSRPTTALVIRNNSGLFASSLLATLPDGFIYRGGSYPGEDGTCSTTIAANATCTLDVAFNPTVAKSYNETISLNYYDGVTGQTVTATLQGLGTVSNDLALSRYETLVFDTVYETYESSIETVTVNHGGGTFQATGLSPNIDSANYTIVTHNCSSLSSGQSCSVQLKFTPQDFGVKTGTLTITYDSNGSPKSVSRSLRGRALETRKLEANTYNVNLGNLPVGFSKTTRIILSKTSSEKPFYRSKAISGTNFSFSTTNCTNYRYITTNCYIDVLVAPDSMGMVNGNLTYTYDDEFQNVTRTVNFSGNAVSAPKLSFDQATFNFGPIIQTQEEAKVIKLTNEGGADLNSFTVTLSGGPFDYTGGSYPGLNGTCSSSLAAGSTCVIDVIFAPVSVGNFSETVGVTYNNDFDNITETANLTGTSKAQAILSISGGSPYDLGTVQAGTSIEEELIVSNLSEQPATDVSANLPSNMTFPGGSFPGDGGTCNDIIAGNSSCTMIVQFTAPDYSPYIGLFRLSYDDGLGVQEEVKEFTAN